jgi:hypothetical protein
MWKIKTSNLFWNHHINSRAKVAKHVKGLTYIICRRFGGASVNIYQTTRCKIPYYSHLQTFTTAEMWRLWICPKYRMSVNDWRTFNLLRQGKYSYTVVTSAIWMAKKNGMYRALKSSIRLATKTLMVFRCATAYCGYHLHYFISYKPSAHLYGLHNGTGENIFKEAQYIRKCFLFFSQNFVYYNRTK